MGDLSSESRFWKSLLLGSLRKSNVEPQEESPLSLVVIAPVSATSHSSSTRGTKKQEDHESATLNAATMTLLIKRTNCQVTAFIFATIGWFLSTTAMGLAEWRLWHMDRQASNIDPNLACVGMWRVCLYYHSSKKDIFCHRFSYGETLLPLDIRVSQNLLLVTTILGLCGKASITLAIKSVYLGLLHRAATCSPFVVSGVLYLIASSCTAVTVAWNFFSVLNEQRFDFPRSVSLPFQPDTQEVGTASLMAALGSLLMLASGLIFLSFKVPQDSQLHA